MSTSAASQAKDAAAKTAEAAKGDGEKKEVAITSRTLFACSALLWFPHFDYVTGEGSSDRSQPWKMFEWQGGPIILAQVETGTWSRRWAAAPSRTPTRPPRWSSPLTPACRGWCASMTMLPTPRFVMAAKKYLQWLLLQLLRPQLQQQAYHVDRGLAWMFTTFGGAVPHRLVEDMAFVVVRFIQKCGSFVNYYMYHGLDRRWPVHRDKLRP
ncbi:beta-galactosidase 4-like [Triticum dicoccoides]|uniref:beta-galactosidase 4-like n=1 Tax=Triticum dicoccoides TaxID=85692 RepID=UPI00188FECC6|nr:beta-galactosidase 4-like [Triticum dicoccoides]